MNMNVRKLEPVQTADGGDVLAVLERRLSQLEARRTAITQAIITLERTASTAREGVTADEVARAEALLDGRVVTFPTEKQVPEIAKLYAERNLVDRALTIGRSKQHKLATEKAGEIWAAHFAEISELEKKRIALALELQKINRAREALRQKITRAGGAGFLSSDGVDLLGLGDVHDEVRWAAERLVADGICSRAEIEKASRNG
jgi:hypothetical protein